MAAHDVYLVPVSNLPSLQATFDRLARRAAKLGSGEIRLQVRDRVEMVEVRRFNEWTGKTRVLQVPHKRVRVSGTRPIITNAKGETWTFVATLQHEDGGTIIRTVPTVEIAEGELKRYRDAKPDCDHCGYERRRKDTFVVRAPNGELKQVGRSCLVDYLGHDDPLAVAKLAELLASGLEACAGSADPNEPGFGGRGELTLGAVSFLETVLAAIRAEGWLSRTKARERADGAMATADYAWSHLIEVYADGRSKNYQIEVKDGDADEAARIFGVAIDRLEAAEDADRLGDYEHNLLVALRSSAVTQRSAGIVASAVGYVQRLENRESEGARLAKLLGGSQHQGQAGDRFDRVVEVDRMHYFDNDFGGCTLVRFHDQQGNAYLWWAAGMVDDLERGAQLWATATVKKHDTDRRMGWPVTVVNRVTFSDDVASYHASTGEPCPHCGAAAGEWCRTPKGGRATKLHRKRPEAVA